MITNLIKRLLAMVARLPFGTLNDIWARVEDQVMAVSGKNLTGAEKLDLVLAAAWQLVPKDRVVIAGQIIRAIVEIVLIIQRLRPQRGAIE
jgi:hypothetical protein